MKGTEASLPSPAEPWGGAWLWGAGGSDFCKGFAAKEWEPQHRTDPMEEASQTPGAPGPGVEFQPEHATNRSQLLQRDRVAVWGQDGRQTCRPETTQAVAQTQATDGTQTRLGL